MRVPERHGQGLVPQDPPNQLEIAGLPKDARRRKVPKRVGPDFSLEACSHGEAMENMGRVVP